MTFRRARSDSQREERRRAILETAAAMLLEMPVAEVSLNEISRRVGLAKSNVLRYVESREAALLDLLHARAEEWLTALDEAPVTAGSAQQRADGIAGLIATTLAERPVLCDLLGAQAAVLERNVSTELAVRHKHAALAAARTLAATVRRHVPEVDADAAMHVGGAAVLCAGAVWTACQPSSAMLAAYEQDPDLAAMRLDFTAALRELVALLLAGLLARGGRLPTG
ncbi:TetR/AcrR family transcriptional regulator [Actinomycetospora endophytica]|uniref:TetR/AcrR family transcriptional regulator n=1 Tax=Actinomycetospora endophytica TaxID=2291215 RepID=A0ABS8P676_9PSEU|nr:TetR/AcrR family transcriptional regulator [Actinomycetospora endophytica]MCD2193417.1 TetR/AcrR family transcriptional regulator [Actinomycetospora endophytica]